MIAIANNSSRGGSVARFVGVGGALVAIVLAAIFPGALIPAWRCAVFVWIGPALGSLVFALVYQLTGGEWGRALRPFLVAGTRLLPWLWLLVLPLLVAGLARAAPGEAWRYAGSAAFAGRAIFYGVIFFLLTLALRRAWPRTEQPTRVAWIGPAGAITLLFMSHLLADDWLVALDPHWRSTAFPVVWLSGQAVAGLAVAVLAAIAAGADPTRSLGPQRRLGLDWGTLLFAAAMFWCYVSFAQFLIIWSGNLPGETEWYVRRTAGLWHYFPLALVALHFVAPLFVLLSRRAKQSRRALAIIAAVLLGAQSLHTIWVIVPAFPNAPAATTGLALAFIFALGGLATERYLAFAREEMAP